MASLKHYREKRDFKATPEPSGRATRRGKGTKALTFVVQKHAAKRLHYDFRLEHDGVLWSWAIPKGPSLDPKDRRLAVRTEDHPLDYGGFEGTIPMGHYGAGKVEIWDRGTWQPEGDPRTDIAKGHLRFSLAGKRLKGRFHLERLRDSAGAKSNWLLIKGRDDRAEGVEHAPGEVAPAARSPRPWQRHGKRRDDSAATVQLATLVSTPPAGEDWIHETKLDGYRALFDVSKGRCRILTRGGHDWTSKFPTLAKAAEAIGLRDAVLDGEIVALDDSGRSDFQLLQATLSEEPASSPSPIYFAFDLLRLDGKDVRSRPLLERKEAVARICKQKKNGPIRYSDHIVGRGAETFRQACKLGLEGIVSKLATSPYREGRSTDWQKSKCTRRQEFVIGGFTDPKGSRQGFGALLVGVFQDDAFVYCGRVGTGFDEASIRDLKSRLRPLVTPKCPFAKAPRSSGVHWTQPRLVCEVAFTEWTRDGALRHPSFQGVREDKDTRSVVREMPISAVKPRTDASLTHPDKILYPASGTTKADVAAYLRAVAPRMLPYVAGRPLALVRCPDGVGGGSKKCFYQKHLAGEELVTVNDADELAALVQLGVLEIHVWGSKLSDLERPDVMVFDLDPGDDVPWTEVVATAKSLRGLLEKKGLRAFAKLTGGKGVHVVVPNDPDHDWDTHKRVAKAISDEFAATNPKRLTTNPRKSERKGRIFIDYLRNGRGATAIAPYSPRAREGASVAVPIAWTELGPRMKPDSVSLADAMRRAKGRDPWRGFPMGERAARSSSRTARR